MRCVQVQEMPPNPTHWTFSGLLFCFFRYVSPPHRWQLLSGDIMFSGSLILVLFFSVGIKDGLCFCGHRSEVSWLRGLCSDAWCWTVMSHPSLAPVLCQRLSLLHNKYFKKMHQEKVRGQGHYDLTPVPFLWVNKHKVSCSRRCVPPQALQFHWCWASGDCRCTLCQSSPSILFLLELIHWNHTCWYCDNLLFLHVAACQAVRQLS